MISRKNDISFGRKRDKMTANGKADVIKIAASNRDPK
jgi:hypothetical protein